MRCKSIKPSETSGVLAQMLREMDQDSLNKTREEIMAPVIYLVSGDDMQTVIDKLCALVRTVKDRDTHNSIVTILSILNCVSTINKYTSLGAALSEINSLL